MYLTPERRGEIAWLYILHKVKKEGLKTLSPNELRRGVGNVAKELGIGSEEADQFAREVLLAIVNEAFPPPKKELHPMA